MGPDSPLPGPPFHIFKMGKKKKKKEEERYKNIILHQLYPSVIHFAAED